ncbi:hypothetical protein AAG906_040382 [Vitis piasezkii]
MASFETVNVLERCQVTPPPVMVDEKSKALPLTFFDMPWLFPDDGKSYLSCIPPPED